MSNLQVLSDEDVRTLLPLERVIDLVQDAFRADAQGGAQAFPVVREPIPDHSGIFGIKSGRLASPEALGLKAGGYWQQNPARWGTSAHQSVIVLFDPASGQPVSVLNANYITEVRTGAAGAVAARALAREDSRTVAIFGAGRQARAQLRALALVLPIEEVRISAGRSEAIEELAQEFRTAPFRVRAAASGEEACRGADIVVTTTPSFEPVVRAEWIEPGTHINAVGADTRGKHELEPSLLSSAKVIVDNLAQASTLGEVQHADSVDVVHATLGEVLTGERNGRDGPAEVTIFDSTGVTFQDLCVAAFAYREAEKGSFGQRVPL